MEGISSDYSEGIPRTNVGHRPKLSSVISKLKATQNNSGNNSKSENDKVDLEHKIIEIRNESVKDTSGVRANGRDIILINDSEEELKDNNEKEKEKQNSEDALRCTKGPCKEKQENCGIEGTAELHPVLDGVQLEKETTVSTEDKNIGCRLEKISENLDHTILLLDANSTFNGKCLTECNDLELSEFAINTKPNQQEESPSMKEPTIATTLCRQIGDSLETPKEIVPCLSADVKCSKGSVQTESQPVENLEPSGVAEVRVIPDGESRISDSLLARNGSPTEVQEPKEKKLVEELPVMILPEGAGYAHEISLISAGDEAIQHSAVVKIEEEEDGQFALEELLPDAVMCTACGKKTNPLKKGICQHPELGVLVCKSCLRFYNSSPFHRDSNGMEEHCKWCAEGGTLVMCDFCEKVYCEQCIKRNLGKDFYSMLLNAEESLKWQCFVCDKSQIEQLQSECNLIMKTLDQLKLKGILAHRPVNIIDVGDDAERRGCSSSVVRDSKVKPQAFRLDSPDYREEKREGQKSMTEKVRKKKVRILESDEDSMVNDGAVPSSRSDDSDESEDDQRKWLPYKPKGLSSKRQSSSPVGIKSKRSGKKKSSWQNLEGDDQRRSGIKDQGTLKRGFGKTRMKTRRRGKLLTDITDPGLGTSKSYANEECFSSDESDTHSESGGIQSVPLSNISNIGLRDFVIRVNELDPQQIENAYLGEQQNTVGKSTGEMHCTGKNCSSKRESVSSSQDCMETNIDEDGLHCGGKVFSSNKSESSNEVTSSSDAITLVANSESRTRRNLKEESSGCSAPYASAVLKLQEYSEGQKETRHEDQELSKKDSTSVVDDTECSVVTKSSEDSTIKKKHRKDGLINTIVELDDVYNGHETEDIEMREHSESVDKSDASSDKSDVDDEESEERKRSNKRKVISSSGSSSESTLESQSSPGEEEEEEVTMKRRLRSRKVPNSDSSSSNDEEQETAQSSRRKSRITRSRKRRYLRKSSSLDEDDDDEEQADAKRQKRKRQVGGKRGKKGKRRRVKDSEDSESEKESPGKRGRRNIRRILKDEELTEQTRHARQLEEERRKRLLARTETKKTEEKEDVRESEGGVTLERSEEGQVLVSVAAQISDYLKPHQKEGVKFMYDCVVESIKKWKDKTIEGGCLLAHCMGLGKTLQVVALVHSLMNNKYIGLSKVLVVAPLNTVLNWQVEFEKWLNVDDRLEVYILNEAGPNRWHRTNMLSDWETYGGVLVMGYEMYRNLSQCNRVRSKKQKEIIKKCLVDPGPELVICDEGHILRNDQSAISKALNNIKTKRRIVLTGTPLQNNLIEYHCMVNFVKPNLLGTRKEFTNRFVNPILNGQLSNSTAFDVKLMKQRCHVLHELLSGCVMRRDYSVLTPFLSPKHEYTVFVRLSEKQRKMYQYFVDTFVCRDLDEVKIRGVSLFSDYQCLMRIWTHPWALKLEALRRLEREKFADDMDSFLNDDSEESGQDEPQTNDYKQGSDSSDFEGHTQCRKKKAGSKELASESDQQEDDAEDKEDEAEGEQEEQSDKERSSSEQEEVQRIRVHRSTRQTRASAARARKSEESSRGLDTVLPSFVSQRRKKKSAVLSDGDEQAEEDQEESIIVVEPSTEPTHKTTRSGSSFKIVDEPTVEEEPEWYDQFLTQEDEHELNLSGKLVVLMEILTDAELMGDKVLVFSQSLVSLDLIEKCLGNGRIGGDTLNWCRGVDYFRMDGSTSAQTRQRYAEIFNSVDSSCRLFLISTRAGSLGINLVAANRVVIFDCSWNPSHDVQSIFRVYRFGQNKTVFVYRLVAQGTMEEKIYNRQITKMAIAGRVVDEQQIERHFTDEEIRELYVFQPDIFDEEKKHETPHLPKDTLLAELLQRQHPKWIVRYHEHDLLLENLEDEKLSEEERKQAWAQYEQEKNTNVQLLARLQAEQDRRREMLREAEQAKRAMPQLAAVRPPFGPSSLDGLRISQSQAEALYRQLQSSGLPRHALERAQIFRQFRDPQGRTVTKMQIPSAAAFRMLQPPQDFPYYNSDARVYRIDGLNAPRPRYQAPPSYSSGFSSPRTTLSGVVYGNLSQSVTSRLEYDPYRLGSYRIRGPGNIQRLPNAQGR